MIPVEPEKLCLSTSAHCFPCFAPSRALTRLGMPVQVTSRNGKIVVFLFAASGEQVAVVYSVTFSNKRGSL